jgi:hypothetical protein
MPRIFRGVQLEPGADVLVPLIAVESFFNDSTDNSFRKLDYAPIARPRPGVSVPTARAEAESIFKTSIQEQFRGSQESSYWFTGNFQLQSIANGVSLLCPKFSSALLLPRGGGALL